MRFVCEKCQTKYTIADEKVRRKVLKIRCKNCSEIIVVRESSTDTEASIADIGTATLPGQLIEKVSQGGENKKSPSSIAPKVRSSLRVSGGLSPVNTVPNLTGTNAIASPKNDEPIKVEQTRLCKAPDFLDDAEAVPDDEWYLAIEGAQFGPMPFSELCSRVKRGETGAEAFVWHDGLDDWLEINAVPELKPYLPKFPPPLPRPRSGLFVTASTTQSVPPVSNAPSIPQATVASTPPPSDHARQGGFLANLANTTSPGLDQLRSATLQASQGVSGANTLPSPGGGGQPLNPMPAIPQMPPSVTPPLGAPVEMPGISGIRNYSPESNIPALPLLAVEPPPNSQLANLLQPHKLAIPQTGTPLLMKLMVTALMVIALSGVILIAYVLFLNRKSESKDLRSTIEEMVKPDPQAHNIQAMATNHQDASTNFTEFAPMEIERSHKRIMPSKGGGRVLKTNEIPDDNEQPTDKLTAEQRRLRRIYGEKGGGGELPGGTRVNPVRKSNFRQITANDIINMQRKHGPELRACYNRALKRDDTLAETKAEITVNIDDRGLVRGVTIKGIDSPDLTSCLNANIRHWVFEPIGEQTFKFPMVFRGS